MDGRYQVRTFFKISLSTVRNEQDIIEPFVRHNLQFLDLMFIADNNSTDDTRAILAALAKETGRVIVFDRFSTAHTQEKFLTTLMHSAVRHHQPDFVFLLDADEFIGAQTTEDLNVSLTDIPRGAFGRLPWRTYILRKGFEVEDGQDPPCSMQFIRRREPEQFYKVVYRADDVAIEDVEVSAGSHVLFRGDEELLPSVDLTIPILHFPVRSEGQLATKSINGWMALLEKSQQQNLGKNEGFHWRQNFERAVNGQLKEVIADASVRYSVSPRPVDWERDVTMYAHGISCERQYSDGSFGSTLAHVARGWELSLQGARRVFSDKFHEQIKSLANNNSTEYSSIHVDIPFWRLIVERFSIASALEFDTATGVNLRAMKAIGGVRIKGVNPQKVEPKLVADDEYILGDVANVKSIGNSFEMVSLWKTLSNQPMEKYKSIASVIATGAGRLIILLDAGSVSSEGTDMEARLGAWQSVGWKVDLQLTLAARTIASFNFIQREAVILRPIDEIPDSLEPRFVVEKLCAAKMPTIADPAFALQEECILC